MIFKGETGVIQGRDARPYARDPHGRVDLGKENEFSWEDTELEAYEDIKWHLFLFFHLKRQFWVWTPLFISQACCNKVQQTGWFNTTEI